MLFLLRFHPLEISVNPFKDLIRLAFAVASNKPLKRIIVVLRLIASLARWNDVQGSSSRTLRIAQRDKMIRLQYRKFKQSFRLSTVSAASSPPKKTLLPLDPCPFVGKLSFPCKSSMCNNPFLFRVFLIIAPLSRCMSSRCTCATASFRNYVRVILSITLSAFVFFFDIRVIANLRAFTFAFLACARKTLLFCPTEEFSCPGQYRLADKTGNGIAVNILNLWRMPTMPRYTRITDTPMPTFYREINMIIGQWSKLTAFIASFKGEWNIQHSLIIAQWSQNVIGG